MSTSSNTSPPPGEEKTAHYDAKPDPEHIAIGSISDDEDKHEVFQKNAAVNFRNVGWVRCSIIFLKILFATGVLSIPVAMSQLGAVGGAMLIIGFGALNTYTATIQGDFRNRHRGCHSIADMAFEVGGVALREFVGGLFIIAYVLCSGAGIVGLSVAFNTFSDHGTCTVWFSLVSAILVAMAASVHKFHELAWVSMAGFVSIFVAVLMVVIAVTTLSRPAAAPQTGPYELGYYAVPPAVSFGAGMAATCTIFISSAGTSAFLPVISEMRQPKDYRKALYVAMGFVTISYLCFALVVYRWCGQWVASPSLGSAGRNIQIASYAVGFIGLIVSACLYLHVAAKYCFVRLLRHSRHLQANTMVHWGTWFGCVIVLAALAFVLAEAIPIFNYLIALTGSLCFAPLAIVLPGWLWLYDHGHWKSEGMGKKIVYGLHCFMVLIGIFICIGGTYGVIQEIIAAYADNLIGGAFSCADNSGFTQ